jgi:hypothetical protein
VTSFALEGNGRPRLGIKSAGGVMKQHGAKKQPTRHDYALALKTIRAQFHTLEAQSGTIRRQNQFMVTVWKDDRTRGHRATSQENAWAESCSGWVN